MSKEEVQDLQKFLTAFDDRIKEIALWLREFVWDLYPNTNELIYDNYNALAFGWSPTPKRYIKKLLKEAYANSLAKVKDRSQLMQGATIVKSISPRKRSPGRRK